MRLSLKAGAFIVAPILLVSLAIYIFIPGIFTYIKVKHDYENIDRTIPAFEKVSVPEDFEEYSFSDVVFSAPAGLVNTVKNGSGNVASYRNDDITITISDFSSLNLSDYYDPWEASEYDKEDYRHFFDTVGHEFPSQNGRPLIWFEKDALNAKMCLHLRSKDLKVFRELAKNKEEAWEMEDTWKLNGKGFTGYAGHLLDNSDVFAGMWSYTLIPDYNPYQDIYFMIQNTDDTTAKQIASSIRLK